MRIKELLIAAGCMLVACGDEDKKDPSTGLDDKKVSELKDAELLDLCEWLINLDDKSVTDEQICTRDAVDSTDDKTDCEEERDLCLEDFEEDEDYENESCTDFSIDKSCTVPVAELKSCMTALLKLYAKAAKEASCDELDAALPATPAACKGLPNACIDFEASTVSTSPSLRFHARARL